MTNYHILTIRLLDLNESKHIASIRKQNLMALRTLRYVRRVFYMTKKAKEIQRAGKSGLRKAEEANGEFGTTVIPEESCTRKSMLAAYEAKGKIVSKLRDMGWNVHDYVQKNSFVYIIHLNKSVKTVKRFRNKILERAIQGIFVWSQTYQRSVSERYRIYTVGVNGKHKRISIVHNHKNGIAWELFKSTRNQ